jgi:carboxymethylenebutenolidase
LTDIHQYLTEEVVEDYADGLIPRREALRQLTLLGVSAAGAVTLLAACGSPSGGGTAASTSSAPGTSVSEPTPSGPASAGPPAQPTEPITFAGPNGTLQGAWAAAPNSRGSVLVIHENKGLTDHIRSVAGRLATSGYSALAIDLLSEEGGTAQFTDPAQATSALNAASPARFVGDMKAGVSELLRRQPDNTVGIVGFCFGGGMVWTLLASGEPRLAAAAPFYGPLPDGADFSGSEAAVLAIYGALDARVGATRPAAEQAMKEAGLTYKVVVYPGANHAFFNDTGERYNPTAAEGAYQQLIQWFANHLA